MLATISSKRLQILSISFGNRANTYTHIYKKIHTHAHTPKNWQLSRTLSLNYAQLQKNFSSKLKLTIRPTMIKITAIFWKHFVLCKNYDLSVAFLSCVVHREVNTFMRKVETVIAGSERCFKSSFYFFSWERLRRLALRGCVNGVTHSSMTCSSADATKTKNWIWLISLFFFVHFFGSRFPKLHVASLVIALVSRQNVNDCARK